jgi:L-seryl-tRNA(Ser) seleniumtransferase
LAAAFRNLPLPVIGRIHDSTLIFDLRCLENEAPFIQQLQLITIKRPTDK